MYEDHHPRGQAQPVARTVHCVSTEVQYPSLMRWWDGRLRSLVFDLVVAVVPLLAHLYSHGGRLPDVSPLSISVVVVGFCALLVRRRFPFAVAVIAALVALVGQPVVGVTEIALCTVAARHGPRWTTWTACAVHFAPLVWRVWSTNGGVDDILAFLVSIVLLQVALPILVGLWVFQRQSALADYRARAEQIERERELLAERAVGLERRRIAREMHDVVAHRVGIVSLHAGALAVNPPDETARELAETIRTTSTTAMSELRDMLRVLRDDDADDEPASTTMLAGISDLVEDSARSGANVGLTMPDPVPDLGTGAQRAAFRVVQEGLTNAGKHAGNAAVHVDVAANDDEVTVTVTNGPAQRADTAALPSSGYGLVGMRERVALVGGRVVSGPTDAGGYRVHATFPRAHDTGIVVGNTGPQAGTDNDEHS